MGFGATLTNNDIKDIMNNIMKISSQEGGGHFNFPGPLMRTGILLMENVLTILAKNILVPLGLLAAVSATDAAIPKKTFGSGMRKSLFSNEEIKKSMK